jgi:hypothetical protein
MKAKLYLFLFLIGAFSLKAQNNPTDKVKDSVKTEVIEVITTFNPKVADASKIKQNPKIKVLEKNKKKKLEYSIFSAPVASTFIPKTGAVKGIDIGSKERLYQTHIKAGLGNFKSRLFEGFYYKHNRFKNEYAARVNYLTSRHSIKNAILNSIFSNFDAGGFYKQVGRYFDWKVDAETKLDTYNWYGVSDGDLDRGALITIDPEQNYKYFKAGGNLEFHDSYVDNTNLSANYFTDKFNSKEILANFDTKFKIPLYLLNDDLLIDTGVEFLNGSFERDLNSTEEKAYNTITVKIAPEYKLMTENKFILEASLKNYVSIDSENSKTRFFILPNLKVQQPILGSLIAIYGGHYSDLKTNTYHNFVEENPFVSPTLSITQTLQKHDLFAGLNGKINNKITYNVKYSFTSEEDKPLFLRNNSNFDINARELLDGFKYGNSFSVIYDDVKTSTIFAEVEYSLTKKITLNSYVKFNSYKTENALEPWNLPALKASLTGNFSNNKWFGAANIFYVSQRKDALYSAIATSTIAGVQNVDAIIDLNLNGGYDLSKKISSFIKINNVLNQKNQQFANFNTQGFQVFAGFIYKFDI